MSQVAQGYCDKLRFVGCLSEVRHCIIYDLRWW